MIIIGAKGFAFEIADSLLELDSTCSLIFYDDMSKDLSKLFSKKYRLISTMEELLEVLASTDSQYTIGFGGSGRRFEMFNKLTNSRGVLTSTISKYARISAFNTHIGEGCNILGGAVISNNVSIGKGSIVYFNCTIAHGCKIADFAEISPGAILLGNCTIGSFTQVGAGATILPNIVVGSNVIVGAGAVVAADVPDNTVVAGVPAKFLRQNPSNS